MLERNRGARLRKTQHIINKRIAPALKLELFSFKELRILDGRVGQSYCNTRGIKCGDCMGVKGKGGCDWCSMKRKLITKVDTILGKSELLDLGYVPTLARNNRK